MNRFVLILTGIIVLIFAISAAFYLGHASNITKTQSVQTAQTAKAGNNNILCTRTTPLENEPQYDRALSLINQRVKENIDLWKEIGESEESKKRGFNIFPATLTNCIKVIEKDLDKTGEEGYVDFSRDDIKEDYFPIIIDSSYVLSDDIAIAFLLVHEMTHVQQFLNSLNGKSSLTCIDREVDAFIAQEKFYLILNGEENSSVYKRMSDDNDPDFIHPQLKMLNNMLTINRESGCGFDLDDKADSCTDNNLRIKLKEAILQDEGYRKQCKI